MLAEFIDFVDSVLPAVSPDFRDGAKEAIRQFERDGHQLKYMTLRPLEDLSQGDVIGKVPFCFFDKNGKQKQFMSDALVLTTSCSIDNKDRLTLAPILPLDLFEGNTTELRDNIIYDYMYIPDGVLEDRFVDFGIMNTYSKNLIVHGLESQKLKRLGSLNQLGYYFFVIKLTVFFMRTEDAKTLNDRKIEFLKN